MEIQIQCPRLLWHSEPIHLHHVHENGVFLHRPPTDYKNPTVLLSNLPWIGHRSRVLQNTAFPFVQIHGYER